MQPARPWSTAVCLPDMATLDEDGMEKQNPSETYEGKPYGHHDPSRPPLRLPHPPAGEPDEGGDDIDPTRQAGIHAIEMYVPRHAVKASVLEKAHGVDGKYTQGLMMTEFCGTGEDEDPVSISLTATSRLMYRYNVKFEEVGMLYVGSESLIDRALPTATHRHALPRTATHRHAPPCTATHRHAPPRTAPLQQRAAPLLDRLVAD